MKTYINVLKLIIGVYAKSSIYCRNGQPSIHHVTTFVLIYINVFELIIGAQGLNTSSLARKKKKENQ